MMFVLIICIFIITIFDFCNNWSYKLLVVRLVSISIIIIIGIFGVNGTRCLMIVFLIIPLFNISTYKAEDKSVPVLNSIIKVLIQVMLRFPVYLSIASQGDYFKTSDSITTFLRKVYAYSLVIGNYHWVTLIWIIIQFCSSGFSPVAASVVFMFILVYCTLMTHRNKGWKYSLYQFNEVLSFNSLEKIRLDKFNKDKRITVSNTKNKKYFVITHTDGVEATPDLHWRWVCFACILAIVVFMLSLYGSYLFFSSRHILLGESFFHLDYMAERFSLGNMQCSPYGYYVVNGGIFGDIVSNRLILGCNVVGC